MQADLIEEDFEIDMEAFDDLADFDDDDDGFEFDDDDDDFIEFSEYDDDDDDYFEMDDDDGDDSEFRRRKRRRSRRHARRSDRLKRRLNRLNKKSGRSAGYVQQRLKGYVKRSELQASLAKVGKDVERNGNAIKATGRLVTANGRRISRVSRSNSKQTRDIATLRKEMADRQQMQLLMTLMDSGPATYQVTGSTNGENGLTSLTMDKQGDQLTTLLPLLMSSGGSGKGGGMGFDNPLMLILLMGGLK